MSYTKMDRLNAIAAGDPADRPPVSAWHHFLDVEAQPDAFVKASVEFQHKFDWDLVKLHPRAVYLAEAMGNSYDYTSYTGPMPRCVDCAIHNAEDLWKISRKSGDYSSLGEQLDVIRSMRQALGPDIPMIQTVFSPLAVFIHMAGAKNIGRNKPADSNENIGIRYLRSNPEGVHSALRAISDTIADYVRLALKAGADGLFYTPMGLARDGYLTVDEWYAFSRAYDMPVLDAAKGAYNVLHTCGMHANPQWFADYPVSVLSWSQHGPGNPSLDESASWMSRMGVMGGVDEDLFASDRASEIIAQAFKVCHEQKNRPFFLSPECSVPHKTPESELMLLREAVE